MVYRIGRVVMNRLMTSLDILQDVRGVDWNDDLRDIDLQVNLDEQSVCLYSSQRIGEKDIARCNIHALPHQRAHCLVPKCQFSCVASCE